MEEIQAAEVAQNATLVVGDVVLELAEAYVCLTELDEVDIEDIEEGNVPEDIESVSLQELVAFWVANH